MRLADKIIVLFNRRRTGAQVHKVDEHVFLLVPYECRAGAVYLPGLNVCTAALPHFELRKKKAWLPRSSGIDLPDQLSSEVPEGGGE